MEQIKNAYGEYWNLVEKQVSLKNGFVCTGAISELRHKLERNLDCEIIEEGRVIYIRPKILKFIEFNTDYQELFNHLNEQHGLILLESEMQEIIKIVKKIQD